MPTASSTPAASAALTGKERRAELARHCLSGNWSKAIGILDSLLSQSPSIDDVCNRAFCYSQLELHKHVIKDCDRALKLDAGLLQAYIMKGRALLELGRRNDAVLAWEQGYKQAVQQSTNLKMLLELDHLLAGLGYDKHKAPVSENSTEDGSCGVITTASGNSEAASCVVSPKFDNNNKASVSEDLIEDLSRVATTTSDSLGVSSTTVSANSGVASREIMTALANSQFSRETIHAPSGNSEVCSKTNGALCTNSNSVTKMDGKPETHSSKREEVQTLKIDELMNVNNTGQRLIIKSNNKTKTISLDFRLSRGIAQVNEGKYDQAISIFNQILAEDPASPEALIGRGTARAFRKELEAAISDFSMAIKSDPDAGEAWKRRGQARAALGELPEAIKDLTKALEYELNSSDILHERGVINFKFKDYNAAVEDLSKCLKLDKGNKSAYTYLGLSLSALGEYDRAEQAHLKSIALDRNFLDAWIHLVQFYRDLADHEKALKNLEQLLIINARFSKAYYLRGMLHHGMGQHREAIKDFSVSLDIDTSNIECLYFRASCHHAVGDYRDAIKDYDAVLDMELDSVEKFVLQCLAFYQKELALYTASKVHTEFCWFDIDRDIDPLFKEYWCKRLHPKNVCEKVFRQNPLRQSLKGGRLRKQDCLITKQKTVLLQAADSLGMKIQYHCPGFLPNIRQYRMAGLAAIEIAQRVSKLWRTIQADWKISSRNTAKNNKKSRRRERMNVNCHNRGGAGCSTSSSSPEASTSDDKSVSGYSLAWKDVYSIAVKWRQISEPCDPVVWVNMLSEEFNAGFGSHTPMLLGQSKVVRYFPYHDRALGIAKAIMRERKYANNSEDKIIDLSMPEKINNIMHAESCSDLYGIVGETFWVSTTCHSVAFDKPLEGTRLTIQNMDKRGFEFAIRTPCTPSRWEEFDAEMAVAWEALCSAYCGEGYGSNDLLVLENVKDAILRMTYYWYNFMPLARGTAVVGYVVLLGLFLAANMEITTTIPEGIQVDWEAILSSHPQEFLNAVRAWLDPSITINTGWKENPDVSSTFSTTGSVVAALSRYDD